MLQSTIKTKEEEEAFARRIVWLEEDIELEEEETRHLPGQHDQQSHGTGKYLVKDWVDDLSADEKSAVLEYSRWGYESINTHLRHDQPLDVQMIKDNVIQNLDTAINKGEIEDFQLVHRGISNNLVLELGKMNIGDHFIDKGFVSTSLKEEVGSARGIHISISLNAGQHVAFVHGINFNGEDELLLPRNSKFKLLSKTKGEYDWSPPKMWFEVVE